MDWKPPEGAEPVEGTETSVSSGWTPPEGAEPVVEKKSPDQTTSEDLETGSEVSPASGEGLLDYLQNPPESASRDEEMGEQITTPDNQRVELRSSTIPPQSETLSKVARSLEIDFALGEQERSEVNRIKSDYISNETDLTQKIDSLSGNLSEMQQQLSFLKRINRGSQPEARGLRESINRTQHEIDAAMVAEISKTPKESINRYGEFFDRYDRLPQTHKDALRSRKNEFEKEARLIVENEIGDLSEYGGGSVIGFGVNAEKAMNKAQEIAEKHGGGERFKQLAYQKIKTDAETEFYADRVNEVIEKSPEFNEIQSKISFRLTDDFAETSKSIAQRDSAITELEKELYETIGAEAERLQSSFNEDVRSAQQEIEGRVANGTLSLEVAEKQFNDIQEAILEGYLGKQTTLSNRLQNEYQRRAELISGQYAEKIQSEWSKFDKELTPEESTELKRMYAETYSQVRGDENKLLNKIDEFLPSQTTFIRGYMSSLGRSIAATSTYAGIDAGVVLGDQMAVAFKVGTNPMEEWKDLFDMDKMVKSSANLAGSMTSSIIATSAAAGATGGMGTVPALIASGLAGWASETVDMTGEMYRNTLAETGSESEASEAASQMVDAQVSNMAFYSFEGLPFVSKALRGIRNIPARMAAGGGIETGTEFIQEFRQGSQERAISEQGDWTKFGELMTADAAKETFLNIAPTFLMGAGGQVRSAISDVQRKQEAQRIATKIAAAEVSPNMLDQFLYQLTVKEGDRFAKAVVSSWANMGYVSKEDVPGVMGIIDTVNQTEKNSKAFQLNDRNAFTYFSLMTEYNTLKQEAEALEGDDIMQEKLNQRANEVKKSASEFLDDPNTGGRFVRITMGEDTYIFNEAEAEVVISENIDAILDGSVNVEGRNIDIHSMIDASKQESKPQPQAEKAEISEQPSEESVETSDRRTQITPESEAKSGDYFTREIDGETIVYEQTEGGVARMLTPEESEQVLQSQEQVEIEQVDQAESAEQTDLSEEVETPVETAQPTPAESEGPTLQDIQEYEALMAKEGPAMESEIEAMEADRAAAMYNTVSEAMSDDLTRSEFDEAMEADELPFESAAKIGYKIINQVEFTELEQRVYEKFADEIHEGISEGHDQLESEGTAEEVALAEREDNNILRFVANYGLDESSFSYEADKPEFPAAFKREVFKKDGAKIDSAREAYEGAAKLNQGSVSIGDITEAVYDYYDYWLKNGSLKESAVKSREAKVKAEERIKEQTKKLKESTNKEVADWLRGQKMSGTAVMFDFGITATVYNSAVDMIANQVEKGTKLGEAVANAVRWVDEQMAGEKWSKKAFQNKFLPKEMPEGFDREWKKAVDAAEPNFSRRPSAREQYEGVMKEFKESELWKGLKESEQTRVDDYVRDVKFNKGVPKVRKPRESESLRKIRLELDNVRSKLKDADPMSRQVYQDKITQLQKQYLKESAKIGKEQAVEGLDAFKEDVKRREKKAKDKAIAREKGKAAEAKGKLQEKLTEVRKKLREVSKKEQAKEKKLTDLSKIKKDLSSAIKDILPKDGVVSRSVAQAISEADTVKKMERVIERIEKMNRRSQEKQEAEARKSLISDIDKFTNPKNFAYKRKGRSLAKSKISPEAQRELSKIREEYDADKLAEISDAELVALHEMVSGVFENGRIAQRDFNKWRTQVNRDLKNRFTEIVADKKGAAKPVITVEDAIAELEKKNIVIVGDKRYSSTMIDQFKADFGVEGELDGKFVVIPSQRGQNKKRVLGYYGRTLDFLSQMYAFISDNASKRWVEENLYRPIAIASKRVTEARFDMAKNERNLKKKIFGSSRKGRRKLISNASIDLVDLNGEKLMDRFTNDHAIYLFNVIQRVDMYRKALAAGISEESLDALVDYVNSDKKLKAYAEGMIGLYQEFLPSVNEALERSGEQTIEGKKIPSQEVLSKRTSPEFAENYYRRMQEIYGEVPETEPYTPASVLGSEIGSMQDMRILGQPQNAISVVSNNAIDVKAGGELQVASNLQLYDSWVEGMANMREKLDLAKTFNAVFNKQNMNLIEKNYGKPYADALRENIDTMLAGRRIDRLTSLEQWLNSASGVTMFLNVSSSIFQQLSKFNFGLGEGLLPQYIANWGKAYWSKDYKEARSEVSNASWVRARLLGDLSSIELAELKQSNTKYQRYLSEVLSKGYILTKAMDINAIISGGTPYYMAKRDQYFEKYSKEMNSSEAMEKAKEEAMNDLYIKTQEAQQSSEMFQRSSEQNNTFKRFLLTFGSVNLQYARVTMRAARDIKNGRGNTAENLAIILYYSAIQQAAFQFLSRTFSSWFLGDDDEEEKNAKQTYWKVANGTLNSFLSGMGAMGAIAAVTKDVLFDAAVSLTSDVDKETEESLVKDLRSFLKDQGMSDEDLKGKRVDQLVYTATRSVAPNVGSKISGMRSMLYDFSNDRPLRGTGELIQFATNIPTSRVVDLSDQVVDAMDSDLESMDRTLRLFNIVKKYDLDKKYGRKKKDLFEKDEKDSKSKATKRSSSL